MEDTYTPRTTTQAARDCRHWQQIARSNPYSTATQERYMASKNYGAAITHLLYLIKSTTVTEAISGAADSVRQHGKSVQFAQGNLSSREQDAAAIEYNKAVETLLQAVEADSGTTVTN
jgi:dihydroorotate dehydrogenase